MKKPAPRSQKPSDAVTIGRGGFAQISAVEGIRLTEEMWNDFRDFAGRRLPGLGVSGRPVWEAAFDDVRRRR